jgi:biotin carboxyl carrier protein
MINSLKSPIDGVVEEIYVSEGKSLMSGEKIMKIVKTQ